MSISFETHTQEAAFNDPREDFKPVSIPVEVRVDPLTGRQTRIVPEALPRAEDPDFSQFVESDGFCFFCPENVSDVTPTYGEAYEPDRGHGDEAISFPNISPYGTHSNVVVLTEDHYLPIDGLSSSLYSDGLAVALDYVTSIMSNDPAVRYASINQNFLPPAGSSIVHPHLQTMVDERGSTGQRRMAEADRRYLRDHDRSYWRELIATERDLGERYLGSIGEVDWVAAFAPIHFYHVVGVLEQPDVPAPADGVVEDVAEGIERILDYYSAEGLNSFNFSWFLAPDDRPSTIHLVGRSVFDQFYVGDTPFFATIHGEPVVDVTPETTADGARTHL